MIAPTSDTSTLWTVMTWLIVPPPKIRPPMKAPTMPTTMLINMPCCASVRMTRLASQPTMPPTTSQMMMPMGFLLMMTKLDRLLRNSAELGPGGGEGILGGIIAALRVQTARLQVPGVGPFRAELGAQHIFPGRETDE